jgi:hypothetical protein
VIFRTCVICGGMVMEDLEDYMQLGVDTSHPILIGWSHSAHLHGHNIATSLLIKDWIHLQMETKRVGPFWRLTPKIQDDFGEY